MAREISAPNILDGVVTEIGRSGNVANIAVDVGNGNYFYSFINRDAFGRLDLRKDDHVKVIFPITNVVLTPAESKYTFSSPNFLQGVESRFTARATIGTGGEKTISSPVELFVPDVSVSFSESKEK
ncbi:TOBE domain-containing protein [Candidatus Methanoperedens nitroreducens]|uniref:TOBE domain-containing protein n=1 Tax=Candidatus Methanoperedens nitratireducens TaxID=1392998 RepID=A0A062V0W0_9EURY|nr:TOBE domain-containing protein [Candidatus Methanoperedens nitroreducens]KCZ70278.1 TOBE domain-containing protein [Candidatus Methanoperedens nitroreducens]MDJ1423118.1 TOBE domain-containing protein [Candidatus Methanoperedens sp.]